MNFLILTTTFLSLCSLVSARDLWSPSQAQAWGKQQPWLVGANFTPASAINQLEMWQAETFDAAGIDRELTWAENLGMNTMRVFLHDLLWEQDSEGLSRRLDQFLTLCAKHKIHPMLVLFDSCWDPAPKLGKQPAPTPGVHNSGWVQSPGAAALQDETQWPRLKKYTQGLIAKFKEDPRILAWDIVNEPDNSNDSSYGKNNLKREPENKAALGFKLVREAIQWALEASPSQPITAAPWNGDWSEDGKLTDFNRHLFQHSDIISFHNYGPPEEFVHRVQDLQRYQRPIICTEYMARPVGSTFQGSLPIGKAQGVGMINWGFVAGKTNTIHPWKTWQEPTLTAEPEVWFHDLFRADGTAYRKEEVEFIKAQTAQPPLTSPKIPGVTAAIQKSLDAHEIAGAVTLVIDKEKIVHFETHGFADVATQRPMSADTLFNLMSMTKPITATAILMLLDEGKLSLTDPVEKFIPEFANLKTPSGKPAHLTLTQILTHTSGLGEAGPAAREAHTLADLIPLFLAAPMQYEPGSKWQYCQSGINTAARIVEIASGQTFPEFLQTRLFQSLGLQITHYPTAAQIPLLATPYTKNKDNGQLEAFVSKPPAPGSRPATGNAGLYATAHDYARFCQMLLNGGSLDGKRYLSAEAMKFLTIPQTGDLPTGFFQNDTYGQHGKDYGWGIATCIVKHPHEGVASMLSPGTYGHGGAWGTQAWIDPVKGVAYILMVQRTNFPNSDASDVRKNFQQAAAQRN
jgi:CubicO group peptidase (beta-lactamase class C family)